MIYREHAMSYHEEWYDTADVSLISIQHTGTRWTKAFLESCGMVVRWNHLDAGPCVIDWLGDRDVPIVIPVRDPMLVGISTINRGFGSLERLWGFQALLKWKDNPRVYFHRVDKKNVDGLCAFLGLTVPDHVDYSPVGESHDITGLRHKYINGEDLDDPQVLRLLDIMKHPAMRHWSNILE